MGTINISNLQRRYQIGYLDAKKLIDKLCETNSIKPKENGREGADFVIDEEVMDNKMAQAERDLKEVEKLNDPIKPDDGKKA